MRIWALESKLLHDLDCAFEGLDPLLHLLALARNLLRLARELCQDVVVVRVDALHQVLVQLVLQRVHLYGCMLTFMDEIAPDVHGDDKNKTGQAHGMNMLCPRVTLVGSKSTD